MSARSRRGGASAPVRRAAASQRVYDDFKPVSKWEQDDEQHILTINLPGFMKEQVKVSTEPQNIIRVGGERLLERNKWSRFQEDYQVPGNAKLNSVRARFRAGGNLIITVPKEKPDDTKPKEQPLQLPTQTPKQTIPQIPEKGLPDHIISPPPEKKFSELLQPPKASDDQSTMRSPDIPRPLTAQGASKLLKQEKVMDKKEEESSKRSKEVSNENVAKKTSNDIEAKKSKGKESAQSSSGGMAMEKCRKAVKGLSEMDEERQLLVNVGAAILVIMSLSAYVTYQFALKKDN